MLYLNTYKVVDIDVESVYHIIMKNRRKTRCDCNYVIYQMMTDCGQSYVGLTRKTESTPLRSLKARWRRHLSRARCDALGWALYTYLRENESAKFSHKILEVVRGRKEAYSRERELILELKPSLNTQYKVVDVCPESV
jgi:hypothetical protein